MILSTETAWELYEKETERRETERGERHTERQRERHTERDTQRETERERERERQRERAHLAGLCVMHRQCQQLHQQLRLPPRSPRCMAVSLKKKKVERD